MDERSEVDRVLARRRMCRDFRADPVDPAVLDTLLAAALGAPAAGNTRGLDLVVLTGHEVGGYWDVTLPPARREGFRWPGLLAAPVLVVPYVDPAAYVARYAEDDKAAAGLGGSVDDWTVPYWWIDGGAAVMGLLVAAEAHGLGALFFGQFGHEAAVAAHLGVPSGRRALGTVAVGHPADDRGGSGRSAPRGRPALADHVRRGGWAAATASEDAGSPPVQH